MKLPKLKWMQYAYSAAVNAYKNNEVPVGAVVVKNETVLGVGFNSVIQDNSVSSHAEINAIIDASNKLNNYRLIGCDIYVTLEPCHMCAKAIVDARIENLFFGALEPKTGSIISIDNFLNQSHLNHSVNYSHGCMQGESSKLLKSFFKSKR
jgi:tRNA(adenine34) deaminase